MIFVKGYGQMCNNILQYAHAYAWGRENGIRVVAMRFAYKYRYFEICKSEYHTWLVYLFAKTLIKLKLMKCLWLQEPEYNESETVPQLKNSNLIAIDGWSFRFPELFLKYKKEINDLFTIKPEITEKVDKWIAARPVTDLYLGLHIRRGDYANWMGGKYFFNDDVYINTIRQFISFFPGKRVTIFICTNDCKLDVNYYKRSLNLETIYLSAGNAAEDLYLLSQCDYLIGVKSTFSLMASFYRDTPLYWIMDKDKALQLQDFDSFENLFMSV